MNEKIILLVEDDPGDVKPTGRAFQEMRQHQPDSDNQQQGGGRRLVPTRPANGP